jgi:hypothetical protein
LTGRTGWVAPEPTALGVPGLAGGTLAWLVGPVGLVLAAPDAELVGPGEAPVAGAPGVVEATADGGAAGGADVAAGSPPPDAPQAVAAAPTKIERAKARAARFGCCRLLLNGNLIRWDRNWSDSTGPEWNARGYRSRTSRTTGVSGSAHRNQRRWHLNAENSISSTYWPESLRGDRSPR